MYGEKIGAQGCVELSDDYVVQNHVGQFRVRQIPNSYTVHANLTAEQCIAECVEDCVGVSHDSATGECRVNTGDVDGWQGSSDWNPIQRDICVLCEPQARHPRLGPNRKDCGDCCQTLQFASADVINPWTFFGALGASYFFAQDETANKEAQFGWNEESYTVSKDLPMPCGADGEWSSDCNDIDESFWTFVEPPNSGDRIVLAQPGANGKPNQRIQQHATFVHDTWEYDWFKSMLPNLRSGKPRHKPFGTR